MEKIIDCLYVVYYYITNYYLFILEIAAITILFFTIDFIIWNKTKKSFWHKIKRTIKKLIEEA